MVGEGGERHEQGEGGWRGDATGVMLQREPEPGGIGEELLLREPRRLGFHVAGGSHDPVQKCLLLACRRRGVAEHGVPALLRDEAHIQGPRYGRQLTATAAAVFAGGRPSGGFGGGCAALRNRRHAGRYRIRRAATMGRRQRRCGVGRARAPPAVQHRPRLHQQRPPAA
ncbi:Os04g0555151, partial [Oryza sativa Japonica Group]